MRLAGTGSCRLECYKIFSANEMSDIIKIYWDQKKGRDVKRQLSISCLNRIPTERSRKRQHVPNKAKHIALYICVSTKLYITTFFG